LRFLPRPQRSFPATQIARLIDGGKLKTNVGAVLPLKDAREAHLVLEHVRPAPKGKIVLAVGAR
jgi:NADPH:quinone reductase-like Zn-dependent oxidoreductase